MSDEFHVASLGEPTHASPLTNGLFLDDDARILVDGGFKLAEVTPVDGCDWLPFKYCQPT